MDNFNPEGSVNETLVSWHDIGVARPMVDMTEIFHSKTKSEERKRKMTSLIVSVVRRKDLSERT